MQDSDSPSPLPPKPRAVLYATSREAGLCSGPFPSAAKHWQELWRPGHSTPGWGERGSEYEVQYITGLGKEDQSLTPGRK